MSSNAAPNSSVLNVSELRFRYDSGKEAPSEWCISGLDFSAKEGEIICILGASGCGKSTLLNLIAGLISPTAGKIEVSRASVESSTGRERRIGYIFQQDALFPWRTVEQNLLLASDLSKETASAEPHERIVQYLTTFHLNSEILKRYPSQLSGGMRQRVSIIQALMFDPKLLLLDEPFSALDFHTKLRLESEFFQLVKERAKAAILVTHDIEEAIAMGDRVFIMTRGGIFAREFLIDLQGNDRLPENARGAVRFAELYREIWSEIKKVMEE